MVKINMLCSIFGSSGYAVHSRNLFNALYQLNPEIHLETQLPQGWELQVNDNELAAIRNPYYEDGVTIFIGLPPFWNAGKNMKHKKFFGYAVWEGDRVPKHWLQHFTFADKIIVPSSHVEDAILNSSQWNQEYVGPDVDELSDKIVTIPHGVDTSLFVPKEKPAGGPFVFFANKGFASGMNDRGGLQFLFRAFAEEFLPEEPVKLLVKINTAYCPLGWNLNDELNKLGLPDRKPQFYISTDTVAYEKLPVLYQEADVFVSPTMGEAFSIPCLEALSCGVPVLTTGFGGQTDYVTEENGWLVPYELFEVTHDVAYEGIRWAKPDLQELKRLLRYAYEHQDEVKSKAAKARASAIDRTWEASAKQLLTIIQKDLEE